MTQSTNFSHSFLTQNGLSNAEVLKRQAEEGFNELPGSQPKKLRTFLLEIARDPMVFLLISCGLIYLALGDPREAMMLLGFLFLIIGITLYQERKAERALEALRELSSPRALVIREGKKVRIAGREVVREDIVLINEGDRVPADGILISGTNIEADESLLTGESNPVSKDVTYSQPQNQKLSTLYAGTTIVRGYGTMQTQTIGLQTELGKIGRLIKSGQRGPSYLETETRNLVHFFTWISGALCILVVIFYGVTRANWLNGFLAGLTLAMAILPNELPAVLTIFLALGAWRISKRRVLVRSMPAVESLGAITVLCVDKTGTLTLNRMTIQELSVNGKTLKLGQLHTLPEDFHEIIEFGILASRKDPFDPMEQAFLNAGTDLLAGTEHLHFDWTLQKEYPLSKELLSISQVWGSNSKGEYIVSAKGAPEAIIDLCHMEEHLASTVTQKVAEMADRGLRVIGVAKAKLKSLQLPTLQHDFDFEFIGLVGLADPVRQGVPQAIADCKTAGIRIVMITGDHPNTARSIAQQIGLTCPEKVISGTDLIHMDDDQLQKLIQTATVFSRITPEQKLRLVNALKNNGDIVAMTGDGINDAPALRSAHVGIAMGARGTDVARESAAIVLLDDDFTSIVEAIRMGRRIYSNLRSALVYLLAVHIPIAGISVLPVLFKLPLVLFPIHIAFLHLIIEPACSIAFETESGDSSLMLNPPRNPREPFFTRKLWTSSLVQGMSILCAVLVIFVYSLYRGQGEKDGRALAFTSLIFSNLVLILTTRRSSKLSTYPIPFTQNRAIIWIILGSLVILGFVLYVPILRDLFQFSMLHSIDLLICIGVGVISVIWFQLIKRLYHGYVIARK